jgi:hypothetical protein
LGLSLVTMIDMLLSVTIGDTGAVQMPRRSRRLEG